MKSLGGTVSSLRKLQHAELTHRFVDFKLFMVNHPLTEFEHCHCQTMT